MSLVKSGFLGACLFASVLSGCNNSAPPTTEHLLREGERCEKDDQCETALCVALPKAEKTCRRTCESGCIGEEICTSFGTNSSGNLRAGCVPNRAGLCTPCDQDTDCPYAADQCLSVGGLSFCGRDCGYDGACPEGYACSDGVSAQGGTAEKQCTPKSATCACIPQTAGQKRPCEVKNSFGRCSGLETCDAKEGFTQCDARVPSSEECDGVDNDCNGLTDDTVTDFACGVGECKTVMRCLEGRYTDGEGGVGKENCLPGSPETELCNGKDDDCDGSTDEGFDLDSLEHCGTCDVSCAVTNGTPECRGGACAILDCNDGFDDCDARYDTGCEVNLKTSVEHCNGCQHACNLDFAVAKCNVGVCEVERCIEGHWNNDPSHANGCEYSCTLTNSGRERCDGIDNDCNGVVDDGIDLTADVNNCGRCGNVCAASGGSASCVNSQCVVACGNGYADCDPNVAGCETNILTSNDHCGGCNSRCLPGNATGQCVGGQCTIAGCASNYQNCNGIVMPDGCEAYLPTDPRNCGQCSRVCGVANGTAGCADNQCTIAACTAPFINCDGNYTTGCLINKDNDLNHCGRCNNACLTRPNSNPVCSAGACGAACLGSFQNCDGLLENGCESDKTSDPLHCGSCSGACPVYANAIATCATSTCGWACQAGWADCAGGSGDGCEVRLDTLTPNASPQTMHCSSTITDLGGIDGDGLPSGGQVLTRSGRGESLFKFRLRETDTWPLTLSALVSLQSPPGVRYAINVGSGTCGGSQEVFEPSAAGGSISISLCLPDLWGSLDDTDVFVEVVYLDGTGCGDWTLEITNDYVCGT